jgi:[ribosomal protein S18]-alanine N-acetyltransferase
MTGSLRRAPCVVDIRWIVPGDIPILARIEETTNSLPWSENDFQRCLRSPNVRGYCAESRLGILGFLIYQAHGAQVTLAKIAVVPSWQGRGIGRQLVHTLTSALHANQLRSIHVELRESNLAAQLFFRACGFQAVSVLRNHYDEPSEDAYVFKRLASATEVGHPVGIR